MANTDTTAQIMVIAQTLGFPVAGVASIAPMDATPFRTWLDAGNAAEMAYLHRHLTFRADASLVLPEARSVICVALPYPAAMETETAHVAAYAQGEDYHLMMQELLQQLWLRISPLLPDATARLCVDSTPLPEREFARRCGIGWVGKNSLLINPRLGSRFVLGEILTTAKLAPTPALAGSCGNCRRCLDACPTGALVAPGIVDARRCLSYLTIEHKGTIPRELRPYMGNRLFGCDTCQDCCPYNRGVGDIPTLFHRTVDLASPDLIAVLRLTAETFNARFRHTPIARVKRRGLLRNACIVLGNQRHPAAIPALREALVDREPLIRMHAAWALGQLGDMETLSSARTSEEDGEVSREIDAARWRCGLCYRRRVTEGN